MKILNTIFAILISFVAFSQAPLINQLTWDNPVTYENSPTPIIKTFGPQSDSLKSEYGTQFLFHDGLYYHVTSWADYFLWFTQKYWYRFSASPELYKFYYESGDNFNMMSFVFGIENDNPSMNVTYGDLKNTFIFDRDLFDSDNKNYEERSRVVQTKNIRSRKKMPFGYGTSYYSNTTNSVGSNSSSKVLPKGSSSNVSVSKKSSKAKGQSSQAITGKKGQ